jgi:hypothetical protein
MIEHYHEKGGRRQRRTWCDSCHALVDDTGPGKDKLPWENRKSDICPVCGGKIFDPEAPKWSPPPL